MERRFRLGGQGANEHESFINDVAPPIGVAMIMLKLAHENPVTGFPFVVKGLPRIIFYDAKRRVKCITRSECG